MKMLLPVVAFLNVIPTWFLPREQLALSSSPVEQSTIPSHNDDIGMHTPSSQVNSSDSQPMK